MQKKLQPGEVYYILPPFARNGIERVTIREINKVRFEHSDKVENLVLYTYEDGSAEVLPVPEFIHYTVKGGDGH